MELRQLAYLVAVIEEANFTRAAARVHVAQPGVSAQIRRLENELGQPLIDRSTRPLRPTEAGRAVLPYARAALTAAAGARTAVDDLAGLVRGQVAIGTVTAITTDQIDLPGLLAAFHARHPAVQISLSAANSEDLLEDLRAGRLDLILINLAAARPLDGVDTQIVAEEQFVAAVSHRHPLAAKRTITLSSLVERELISLPRGTGQRASLEQASAARGLKARVSFEAGDPRVLAELAATGLGVAVVPRPVAAAQPDSLHVLEIIQPRLKGELALAWRTTSPGSPAARALIDHARTTLASTTGSPPPRQHP
jgi:DNA-binding transcriptional LysR family regulator